MIDSPSAVLAAARASAVAAVPAPSPAIDDRAQEQAQPAPPRPTASSRRDRASPAWPPRYRPAMLLRAAAIDDAARDVLAYGSLSSRRRDTINRPHRSRNERR